MTRTRAGKCRMSLKIRAPGAPSNGEPAMRTAFRMLMPALLLAAGTVSVHAELVRIEITSTKDVLGGKAWGSTGVYEELIGTAYITIDPKAAANRNIPDIA